MFRVLPRQGVFFDLFDRAAANMVHSAELFQQLLEQFDQRDQFVAALQEAEHQGDRITHETMNRLDQTFLTPFDREDIHDLCKRMDDVVDAIEFVARRIQLYRIEGPSEDIKKMAGTLVQIVAAVSKAITQIRNIRKRELISDLLIEIHRLENQGDDQSHAALGRLFANQPDPIEVIKWKEIYDRTEDAIDGCEAVANLIRALVFKHA